MSAPVRADTDTDTGERLRAAAVATFAERGFHAATTREISARAGVSPAALYVHFRDKQSLLARVSRDGHRSALAVLDAVGPGPAAVRLRAMVRAFATWHARHQRLARVIEYELDALADGPRAEVAALRREIARRFRTVLADGVAEGGLAAMDVPGTAQAIVSLCTDVARWYRAGGRRTPESIGRLYGALALRMVGPSADTPADTR